MLKRTPNSARPLLVMAGAGLTALAIGCAVGPPVPLQGPFDGTWVSPQLGYDLHLQEPLGVAIRPRIAGVESGDPVFRMTSFEGRRFTARQWMPDGTWHTVTGELKPDGRLSCSDGAKTWMMERRGEMKEER
ncbi:MAG: hypothetical protein ACREIE_09645 [Nitrospiraceae bacterium]